MYSRQWRKPISPVMLIYTQNQPQFKSVKTNKLQDTEDKTLENSDVKPIKKFTRKNHSNDSQRVLKSFKKVQLNDRCSDNNISYNGQQAWFQTQNYDHPSTPQQQQLSQINKYWKNQLLTTPHHFLKSTQLIHKTSNLTETKVSKQLSTVIKNNRSTNSMKICQDQTLIEDKQQSTKQFNTQISGQLNFQITDNKINENLQKQIIRLKSVQEILRKRVKFLENQQDKSNKMRQQHKNYLKQNIKLKRQLDITNKENINLSKKYKQIQVQMCNYQKQKKYYLKQIHQLTQTRLPKQIQQLQTYRQMSLQNQLKQLREKLKKQKSQRQYQLQCQLDDLRKKLDIMIRQYNDLDICYRISLRKNQINHNINHSNQDLKQLKQKYQKLLRQNKIFKKTNLQISRELYQQKKKYQQLKNNQQIDQFKGKSNKNIKENFQESFSLELSISR